jgi:hypothetical protein
MAIPYQGPQVPQRQPAPQGGLLGQTPAQARADAFLAGLGGMGAGLLQAGATTTDPSQFGRGMANAAQGFTQGRQASLQNTMAQEAQKRAMALANAEAARKAQSHNLKISQIKLAQKLLSPQQPQQRAMVPTSNLASGPEPLTMLNGSQSQAPVMQSAQQSLISQIDPAIMSAIRAAPSSEQMSMLQKALQNLQGNASDMFSLSGNITPVGIYKAEEKIRGELNPIADKIAETDRFANIATNGFQSKIGDGSQQIAALVSMVKMIDPGMVTPGELDLQRSALTLADRFTSAIQSATTGAVLPETLRAQLVDTVKLIQDAQRKTYAPRIEQYKGIVQRNKLNWENVWTGPKDFLIQTKPKPTAKKKPAPQGTGSFVPVPPT